MEEITTNLGNLNLNSTVGIIHHPFCMKHSAEIDSPPSMTSFIQQERPQRMVAILERLKQENLLSKCEVIDDFEPCTKEEITLLHEKKYLEHIEDLFQEEGKEV